MIHIRSLSATAALAALLCAATAAAAGDRPPEGLLAELPANAPPGDCYAHVRVRGSETPPQVGGAVWVQTPGPPGAPGPIWCLVPTAAHAPPPVVQEGWIRVVCDRDVTPDRVRKLQRRLHERGFYQGPESGEYDRPTADVVGRFQRHARIDHGGYLSLDTWEALNGDETWGGPPPQLAERPPLPPERYDHSRPERDIPPPVRYEERRHAERDVLVPRYDERYGQRDLPPPVQYSDVVRESSAGGVQRYYSHRSYSRSSSSVTAPQAVYGGGYGGGYAYSDSYGPTVAGGPSYADPAAGAYPGYDAGWRPPYAAIGAGSAVQNGYLVWGGKTRF